MNTFDHIARFKLIQTEKGCPLAVNERIVYSFLVYRYCLIKSHRLYWTTALQIGSATGLDRRITVPAALKALVGHGLAVKKGRGWYAQQPDGPAVGWFRTLSRQPFRGGGWYDGFAYNWHPVPGPACPLTPRQLYLYGLYASLIAQNKRNLADKYLALIAGLDPATVRHAREKLFALGLLVDGQFGWGCPAPDPTTGWFKPVGDAPVAAAPSPVPKKPAAAGRPAPARAPGGPAPQVERLVPFDLVPRRPEPEYDPGRRLADRGFSEFEVLRCLARYNPDIIRKVDEAHPEPLGAFAFGQHCADARIALEPWASGRREIGRPVAAPAPAPASTGTAEPGPPPPAVPPANQPAAPVRRRAFEEAELAPLRALLRSVVEQLRHEAWGEEPDDGSPAHPGATALAV